MGKPTNLSLPKILNQYALETLLLIGPSPSSKYMEKTWHI